MRVNWEMGEQGPKTKEQMISELGDKIESVYLNEDTNVKKLHEEVISLTLGLEKKYPDIDKRKLIMFHVLVGSTLDPDIKMQDFDYPDREIEKFLQELPNPYK